MIWNYNDDDKPGIEETAELVIENITVKTIKLNIFLIDSKNSNSYEVWKQMGSPQVSTIE